MGNSHGPPEQKQVSVEVHMNSEVVLAALEDGTSGASSGKMFVVLTVEVSQHQGPTTSPRWNVACALEFGWVPVYNPRRCWH
ncbi:hypothetical protein MHYP_G00181870 [Metynnis hypsauchen]